MRLARYLVTGGVNTLLSYAVGASLFYILIDKIHYMIIMVIGTVVNITISYFNYKLIVFKTKGNYIREYLRFYVVYSVPIGFSFIAFPICYQGLGMNPYLAQALIMAVTVVVSYIGHKKISFRQS
jgi:putative flippase GtrA